jgi:hypothetical protein
MAKKLIFVKLSGTGIHEQFRASSHEILGLPAGTYHKFVMENGSTLYVNDFGLRSVVIGDSQEEIS